MLYRKKPVTVEAEQWQPEGPPEAYSGPENADRLGVFFSRGKWWIETPAGWMRVNSGDWIITGTKGEKNPYRPDVFQRDYEPADTPPAHEKLLAACERALTIFRDHDLSDCVVCGGIREELEAAIEEATP